MTVRGPAARVMLLRRSCAIVRRGEESYSFLGRAYEEACGQVLAQIGISLRQIGGSGDGGIDLQGHWHLGEESVPVIAQCKRISRTCPPIHVRELEGTLGKRVGEGVALLVASSPASTACIAAVMESRLPLLFLHLEESDEGDSSHLLRKAFGNAALQKRLPALLIGSRHHAGGRVEPIFYCKSSASVAEG